MILRTKPYTVGCGIHLNPHGNDVRCGLAHPNPINGLSSEIVLCDNCRVRHHANSLMEQQSKRGEKS